MDVNNGDVIVGELAAVTAAQRRVVDARLLVRGGLAVRDATAFHAVARVRGQLLRAAADLERSAGMGHWLAPDHLRGAAQARRAARLVGRAMAQSRHLDPAQGLSALLAAYRAARGPVEAAFGAAYAGTHP